MKKRALNLCADFCKIFSNPLRLEILCLLRGGELTAGEITRKLAVPKANASQHLTLMRLKHIVAPRREGTKIYYSIANAKIGQACSLIQEGLARLDVDEPAIKRRDH